MAKKKRHRRRRLASAALLSAPRRRRRMSLSTTPRRRKRKRGLSEFNLVKGKMGTYVNPILEGAMGGVGTQLLVKTIPQTWFDATKHPDMAKNENIIKGLLLLAGAGVAAHFKQPLIAAGMAGGAAILTMQKEGILQEDSHGGFSNNGRARFQRGRFADPNLLSEAELLSEDIYPPWVPMYESPKSEFRY